MKKPIIFLLVCLAFGIILNMFSPVLSTASALKNSDTKSQESLENSLKISAKSALLMDYESGTIVYQKNADERLQIASMTKLCSLSIILDALERGAIKPTDMVTISENSANVGGSSAFLDAGSSYKVSDLIKTIVVASANDSTVALAEFVAGSEDVFVTKMNKLVQNLGLKDTHFVNSTGLPASNHYSTARDIAEIYKTVCNNALYRKYSKIWTEDFIHPSGRKTGLVNTNRLIRSFEGIDGGKTGYTDSARFCLTTSATRGNTRFIAVVIGASDSKTRFKEASELLNFGFANYESKLVVNSNISVAVSGAKRSKMQAEIFASRDSLQFKSKNEEKDFKVTYEIYDLKAPVLAGEIVGKLYVYDDENLVDEIDLVTKSDILPLKFKDTLKLTLEKW